MATVDPAALGAAGGSAWLPSAPCTPQDCLETRAARSLTTLARAVPRLVAVLLLVLAGILLTAPAARLSAATRDRLIRPWCRAIARAAGVQVRITGAAPVTGGALLVANHISWLDIPLLAAVRPARMVAKAEIRTWPVAGVVAARGGCLFIDRDRLRALPATVATLAGTLRAGTAVTVFPEGSTWCGREQGYFRRAVFQAALDARVPVQPVRIRYLLPGGAASTAPAFVGQDTLPASLWRVVTTRRIIAEVEVMPPLAPGAHTDRRALADAAQLAVTGTGPGPTSRAGHRWESRSAVRS